MKIGIQTSGVVEIGQDALAVDAGYARIRRAGFDCVDFNINTCLSYEAINRGELHGAFDLQLPALLELLAPHKRAAEKHGLSFAQMHAPFPSYSGKAQTDAYLAMAFEKCVEACAYLECPYLVIHPVLLAYDAQLAREEEWAVNERMLIPLIPLLQKHGVIACLENMIVREKRVYEASCANMVEVAQHLDELNRRAGTECFGFCYDTGHALILGTDPYEALRRLGPRLKALHIHDNDGQRDQHFIPYTGILDWTRFIKGLRAIDFDGVLSYETVTATNLFGPEALDECLALQAAVGRRFLRMLARDGGEAQ